MEWVKYPGQLHPKVMQGYDEEDEEGAPLNLEDVVKKYLGKDISKCWYLEGSANDDAYLFIRGAIKFGRAKWKPDLIRAGGPDVWLMESPRRTLLAMNENFPERAAFALRAEQPLT